MRHTSDNVAIDHLAIAILRRDDCVVLVQQQAPGIAQPYWVLPGGLVESGELVMDALVREVQEEAGAHVTAIAQLVCFHKARLQDLPDRAIGAAISCRADCSVSYSDV